MTRVGRLAAGAAALALLPGVPPARGSVETIEQFVRHVQTHVRLDPGDCSEEERERDPGEEVVCATRRGRWSAFKSDWEYAMGRYDLPEGVRAGTPWILRGGRYERVYEVEGSEVMVSFDEGAGRLVLAYAPGDGADDAPGSAPTPERVRAEPAPKTAGFGGVTTPRLVGQSRVEPAYPEKARAAEIEGSVLLDAAIHADGTVGELKVLSARPEGWGFAEAAIEAVRQWRYEPARERGRPVDVLFTIYVEFVLPPEQPAPGDDPKTRDDPP